MRMLRSKGQAVASLPEPGFGQREAGRDSSKANNAIWHDVNAVKNNRVYQLPPSLFTVNPGTHTIDAMKIMKEYMYGEAK